MGAPSYGWVELGSRKTELSLIPFSYSLIPNPLTNLDC